MLGSDCYRPKAASSHDYKAQDNSHVRTVARTSLAAPPH